MKIAYCLNSVNAVGGIAKVTIVKANALSAWPDNRVYLLVTDNKKGKPVEPIAPNVQLIDLDINYYADDWKSRWHVLKGIIVKRRVHKQRLEKVLSDIRPDIVISVGQAEKNILATIPGDWIKIREFHFVRNYRMLHANSLFAKILALLGNLSDHMFLRKYDQIVVLTKEDRKLNWKGYKNLSVIPNPITFCYGRISRQEGHKVVAIGRLEFQKNYSSLIRSFRTVVQRHPDWSLEIYGTGSEEHLLQKSILEYGLEQHVFLKGYTADVQRKCVDASIFVHSSLSEGFGLSIVEAMACGLPVVSYSCPCGPKDIISDGKDGFLVPVNDEKQLTEKICYLIEHVDERIRMGRAAVEKAYAFSVDHIMPQWMFLFNALIKK